MRGFLVLAPGTGGLFPLLASSEAVLALEQARRARWWAEPQLPHDSVVPHAVFLTKAPAAVGRVCTPYRTQNVLTRPTPRPIVSVGGRPRTRNAYPGRDRSPPLLGASQRELPRPKP